MALDGGGGGGGGGPISSSNPAGTGSGLNYIGNHCYAYSGTVGVNGTETTLVEFTTGASVIRGQWLPQILVTAHHGDDIRFACYIDEEQIMATIVAAATGNDLTGIIRVPLIIPPFTRIKITGQNISQNLSKDTGATFTGRVYA